MFLLILHILVEIRRELFICGRKQNNKKNEKGDLQPEVNMTWKNVKCENQNYLLQAR